MRLIDEKARLFGKFNLLDIAIFIIAVVSFVSVYMAIVHKDKLKKIIQGEDEAWYISVSIILNKDDFWMKNYINPGDTEKDIYARLHWQILDLREITDPDSGKRLIVKVKLAVKKEKTGKIYYGRYIMRVGEDLVLRGGKYVIKGTIYAVGEPLERMPF